MGPDISSRSATPADIPQLVRLHRLLADEMTALEDMWPLADALAEPLEGTFERSLVDETRRVVLGTLDDVVLGFAVGQVRPLLPHTGERVGAITHVYTEQEARAVGIGSAMRDDLVAWFLDHGVRRLDAHVVPGHRLAKNFFEAAGFSARHIVMHADRTSDA